MSEPVRIPNPLYDVVFRYMMDDQRVARLFLTAILGKKVLDLEFQSTEQSLKLGEAQITVTRMDFRARIQQADGREKMVLIELQKAKLYQQIGRFRRYLGQQYQRNPQAKSTEASPIPIYPIYILGEPYSENGIPIVRVQREAIEASTGEKIEEKHPFIEALTHDAIIIQVPYITGRRRTDLERILSIFDQSAISDTKGHILTLEKEDFPVAYQAVIRRLQLAMANPALEADMDLEDEVLQEFQKKEEQILAMRQLAEAERSQKEIAQRLLVQVLAQQGNSLVQISQITGLEEELIKQLLNETN